MEENNFEYKHLLKSVNDSGFPFQIGVTEIIKTIPDWHVEFTEHSWENQDDNSSGFIDIVVRKQIVKAIGNEENFAPRNLWLVIECKRITNHPYIFLESNENKGNEINQAKTFLSSTATPSTLLVGHPDIRLLPTSYESNFCVVTSQDHKKPLLEKVASELVSSTSAFASEIIHPQGIRISPDIFVSIIVLNLPIILCRYSAPEISIKDGTLSNPEFETVPYLRFRKQFERRLDTREKAYDYFRDWGELAKRKEHTVFVVSAENLPKFLNELRRIDLE
jgi:hypothetical protein